MDTRRHEFIALIGGVADCGAGAAAGEADGFLSHISAADPLLT